MNATLINTRSDWTHQGFFIYIYTQRHFSLLTGCPFMSQVLLHLQKRVAMQTSHMIMHIYIAIYDSK